MGIDRTEGSGLRLEPGGSRGGWWAAYSRPLISVRGRARSARSTKGEISVGGARDEKSRPPGGEFEFSGGADGDRTHDLSIANATLSQLSYGPTLALRMLARIGARFK